MEDQQKMQPLITTYVPIKTLCEKTSLCEKTIRKLIREHGLPHHRSSPRGKILVDLAAFARYMESTRVEARKDPLVMDVLKDLRQFMEVNDGRQSNRDTKRQR